MNVSSWNVVVVAVAIIAAATAAIIAGAIGETAFVALVSGAGGFGAGHSASAWSSTNA